MLPLTPYRPERAAPYLAPAYGPRSLLPWEIDTSASTAWGGTSGKGHRVTIGTDSEGKQIVRSGTESEYDEPWKLPTPEPRVHYRIDDIHGPGTMDFAASVPEIERFRQVKIQKELHGPDSDLPCCLAKRKQIANDIAA